VILCENCDSALALELGARIAEALGRAFHIRDDDVFLTASTGIALADSGSTPESLLRDADAAMYCAKDNGRARVEVFDDALRERVTSRLRIESALRHALPRNELAVHYQPIVSLADGSVMGLEALLRWTHPELGPISPADFIPRAEETGLIVPIGRWVVEQACREAVRWRADHGTGPDFYVSVNLSPRQLAQPDFPSTVASILEQSGMDPAQLAFEITESILMQNERPLAALDELRGLGVGIILDDFGTGYSSLGYLQRLPIDTVKLDRAFITGLEDAGSTSTAIVSAVVTMAQALDLTVVGEGVETAEQGERLRRLGCGLAQGFHFGRPAPPETFTALLGGQLQARRAAAPARRVA
jgi:predicted signal transduction protein with EAL and GGDEF domain